MATTVSGTIAHKHPVLITGAGQRIGRSIALDFGRRGYPVAVHVNASPEFGEAVVRAIREAGGQAALVHGDLADAAAVAALVPAVTEALGAPATLVNNASLFVYDDIASLDDTLYDKHLAINLKAPVFLAKALARSLPAGAAGNVINIIDQRVWKLTPHFLSYTIAKSGLWSATRQLAQALAPRIRVNAIGPGPALQSVHQTADEFAAQAKATLLERGTSPDEIAATIRFILDAPAMTGQMIALDGGQHLAWATADVGDGRG